MIDIRMLRDDPEGVTAALARRGVEESEIGALLAADVAHRALQTRSESLRAEVKSLSRLVAEARRGGDDTRAEELRARSRLLGEEERALATEAEGEGERVRQALLYLPNIPADEVPDGESDVDNAEIRRWWPGQDDGAAEPLRAAHQQVPHWDIGHSLRLLDMERGARLSGSMFPLYRGAGARLLRALTALALDRHTPAYEEIRPPTVVLTETMVSTGHLPKFADDAYHIERDDLWAIPTAEVPLTSLHRGEILEESVLPLRFTAATACYRREAGSAGSDTRGLLRVHEFDKVELFAYTTPDQALDAQADILRRAESLLQELGLRYRVMDLCTGDLSGALGPHVRPRGLLLGGRQVAGGQLDQLVPRLPGPPGPGALPTGRRGCTAAGPHGERVRPGLAPDLGRADRERASGGRSRAAARLPGALPRGRARPAGSLTPQVAVERRRSISSVASASSGTAKW